MKKSKVLLCMVLCVVFAMTNTMVFADTAAKNILTLGEAKKIALQNDVQLKLQDSYIQQKTQDYSDKAENFSVNRGVKGSSLAGKAEGRINNQVSLESSNYAVKQEVFNKSDLKRQSDYNVTKAYYDVMKAKYTLDDATRALKLAKKDVDIAKIKVDLGLITSTTLTQVENAYKSSQTAYNTAVSDLQTKMATLGKNVGKTLDLATDDVDMSIGMPDLSTLNIDKLKTDNLKNNPSFFALNKALDLQKYKTTLVASEYDDNIEKASKQSDTVRDAFEELLYESNRDYNDAKYNYDQAEKELDITLKSGLSGLTSLKENIDTLGKNVENARITYAQNKTKYDLGMISLNEFEKSESNLKDLENQLSSNIINLNLQYVALTQYSYTVEK